MKLIICGGRDYTFTPQDYGKLNQLQGVTEVFTGCSSGADYYGEVWAHSKGLKVKRFPADWETYGKKAGPYRNRQMAEEADAVAVFPGGKGTDSMLWWAEKKKLQVFDFR